MKGPCQSPRLFEPEGTSLFSRTEGATFVPTYENTSKIELWTNTMYKCEKFEKNKSMFQKFSNIVGVHTYMYLVL